MNGVPVGLFMRCQDTKRRHRLEGFSLLEMMVVVTVILIVASISAPIYMTAIVRAREAVLARRSLHHALFDRPLHPRQWPRPFRAPRVGDWRLLGENPDRPLHGIKRDLAGDKGRRAPPTQANDAGDCGRTQRLGPRFPRRHAVQHVVARRGLGGFWSATALNNPMAT